MSNQRMIDAAANAVFPGRSSELSWTGMSCRELFAAVAMHGLVACPANAGPPKHIAQLSVVIADALIAELAKQETPE